MRELQGSCPGVAEPGVGRSLFTATLSHSPGLSLSETPFRTGPLGSTLIALPALFSVSLFSVVTDKETHISTRPDPSRFSGEDSPEKQAGLSTLVN